MSKLEEVLEKARKEEKKKKDLEKQVGLSSFGKQKNELKNEENFVRAFDELITLMINKATTKLENIYSGVEKICSLPFDAKTEDEKIVSLYDLSLLLKIGQLVVRACGKFNLYNSNYGNSVKNSKKKPFRHWFNYNGKKYGLEIRYKNAIFDHGKVRKHFAKLRKRNKK